MDGCLFGLLFLLWEALKGILKLVWWIVSFPYKAIKRYIDGKKDEEIIIRNKIQHESELASQRQTVEVLFSKIRSEIFTSNNSVDYPDAMDVYHSYIRLYYKSGEKTINYRNYGIDLELYSTWFTIWGPKSEEKVNQPLLLAEKINAVAGGIYRVNPVTKFIEHKYTDDTMTTYIQEYVRLTKK